MNQLILVLIKLISFYISRENLLNSLKDFQIFKQRKTTKIKFLSINKQHYEKKHFYPNFNVNVYYEDYQEG